MSQWTNVEDYIIINFTFNFKGIPDIVREIVKKTVD